MSRSELRLAGFGGQGIVLSGMVLGSAASMFGGKHACQTQSYGPEARGGACKAEIIISDQPVDYPMSLDLEVLVAMSQEALDRYIGDLRLGGVLIVDADLIRRLPPEDRYQIHRVPATSTAEECLGRRIVANMVMLGALVAITGVVSRSDLESAVKSLVPKGTENLNIKAIRTGQELVSA